MCHLPICHHRSLKRRLQWGNLRAATSGRPDDTADQVLADNAWKVQFQNILDKPGLNGIPWQGRLPECCCLAMDETFLVFNKKRRTYVQPRHGRRVPVVEDKRGLTGAPVVGLDGACVLFQVSFFSNMLFLPFLSLLR